MRTALGAKSLLSLACRTPVWPAAQQVFWKEVFADRQQGPCLSSPSAISSPGTDYKAVDRKSSVARDQKS